MKLILAYTAEMFAYVCVGQMGEDELRYGKHLSRRDLKMLCRYEVSKIHEAIQEDVDGVERLPTKKPRYIPQWYWDLCEPFADKTAVRLLVWRIKKETAYVLGEILKHGEYEVE